MPLALKNKNLELRLDLPEENYQFSRFDWTGKITSVSYKGIDICGNELKNAKTHPKTGRGFYNEFGILKAVGYTDIEQGDWFHKIGVGLLQKKESTYDFLKDYKIKPADFEVKYCTERSLSALQSITLKCTSALHNGYAYVLEKQIQLTENGFIIGYNLKNTGCQPIMTKEYNHNFLSINQQLIGKNYKLKFNFNILPEHFSKTVNPNAIVNINTNDFKFKDTPQSDFFFGNISGGKLVNAKWTLEDSNTKTGITEEGDFKVNTINLWGCAHVICTELFIDIHLKPDESMHWSRRYSVLDLNS